jgi:hypothetical protein
VCDSNYTNAKSQKERAAKKEDCEQKNCFHHLSNFFVASAFRNYEVSWGYTAVIRNLL